MWQGGPARALPGAVANLAELIDEGEARATQRAAPQQLGLVRHG